jgi:hypothetical protein
LTGATGATGPQGIQGPAGTYTAGTGILINNNEISVNPAALPQQSQGVRIGFSSSTTWTCPAGITQIQVELWGGGGGGGSSSGCVYRWNGNKCYVFYNQGFITGISGGSGGLGGYNKSVVNVIPGNVYSIAIGSGGVGGIGGCAVPVNGGTAGGAGGGSNFTLNASVILSSSGGSGGAKGVVGCNCPTQVGTIPVSCSGAVPGVPGANGIVTNYIAPTSSPTIPSYIPTSYLSAGASCCANFGLSGGSNSSTACLIIAENDNNYPKHEYSPIAGSAGESGFCVISY